MCEWGNTEQVRLCKPKDISKREEVPVDACLAPLVQMLNDYGIETIACCCGHGAVSVSSIRIHPKNIKLSLLGDTFSAWLEFPYKMKKEMEKR